MQVKGSQCDIKSMSPENLCEWQGYKIKDIGLDYKIKNNLKFGHFQIETYQTLSNFKRFLLSNVLKGILNKYSKFNI